MRTNSTACLGWVFHFPCRFRYGVPLHWLVSTLLLCVVGLRLHGNERPLLSFGDSLLRCMAPADTAIRCGDPALSNLDALGRAVSLSGLTGNLRIVANKPVWATNSCQQGKVTQSWQVVRDSGMLTEAWGDACTRVIQILPDPSFALRFPADTTVSCNSLKTVDSVRVSGNSCQYFSVSYQDTPASSAVGGCYRVFRTYQVINWCMFNPLLPPVIIGRDVDKNGVAGDSPLWLVSAPDGHVYLDKDTLPLNDTPKGGYWLSSKEDASLSSNAYWEYQQVITIRDETPPVIICAEEVQVAGTGLDCTGDLNFSIRALETCSPEKLKLTVTWDKFADGLPDEPFNGLVQGGYPSYRLLARLPFGSHRLTIRMEDGCGNFSEKKVFVQVSDRRAPEFRCINSIIIQLIPLPPGIDADRDGDTDPAAVTVWAEELISSPATDCSFDVRYSVHRAEAIESGLEKPSPDRRSIVLTCDDKPTVLLYVYAWDASGNYAFGETFVLLHDLNGKYCQKNQTAAVSGLVKLPGGKPLPGVSVVLSGEKIASTVADGLGYFSFDELKVGSAYVVQAGWDSFCKEGVSTQDIVAILQHILGKAPFAEPWQHQAADVDQSGVVSILDVIKIRRLILGIDACFAEVPAWLFYESDSLLTFPGNPLGQQIQDKISILRLSGNVGNLNFTGIKTGDVTGDVFIGKGSPVIIQY